MINISAKRLDECRWRKDGEKMAAAAAATSLSDADELDGCS